MIQTSYSEARERLASLMDKATEDRETVIIKRRGHPDVALIAADELAGLEETAHLLRSPANAVRLFEGLAQAGIMEPRLEGAGDPGNRREPMEAGGAEQHRERSRARRA